MAADVLLSHDFASYAYVSAYSRRHWSEQRRETFRQMVTTAGGDFHVFDGVHQETGSAEHSHRLGTWLQSLPKPCGLLAANDRIAALVLHAAKHHNVDVPGMLSVIGIDNDEDAVRIAGENAAANDIEAAFQTQDLAVCDLQATVVVANVLAPVLIQFAESIARCVRRVPGNALILSGILETQYDDVRDAYAALGFRERKNILIGEWKSGLFELTA